MSSENEDAALKRRLSCTKYFDALYFCYSPFYQMQQYYRIGELDNCFGKWSALYDCLCLKTKKATEVESILEAREKAQTHIWTFRTPKEAERFWNQHYGHLYDDK
ncbi:uncharacterized protein C227.17c-like isoform X1 [Salvia splendens]|uniref:uncharacterized protein C227.17c-like isoform X1 n=1 Tax=Salvia splendens TaxID=180675 RepID=UPI001C266E96|nr:uncharacterized protein C227.17c-like isoform X1 [Salvia splendens]XP_042018190.1 uncharacterized protein C227.17c-like isoform X1 [Salvia splendens]